MIKIGPLTLSDDGKELLKCNKSATKVVISDSVTHIGSFVFWNCTKLTSITIPNSVTSIGDWAFCGCVELTSITIPDSVTSIGDKAFQGCTKLQSKPAHGGSTCYKGMKPDLTCRGYQYEVGKTYIEPMARCCECGFHACTNLFDVFNYYYGEYGKDFVITECTHGGQISEHGNDSKFACTELTVDRVLTREEIIERLNN